jgi:hypothetical protein
MRSVDRLLNRWIIVGNVERGSRNEAGQEEGNCQNKGRDFDTHGKSSFTENIIPFTGTLDLDIRSGLKPASKAGLLPYRIQDERLLWNEPRSIGRPSFLQGWGRRK